MWQVGTLEYMAPEVLLKEPTCTASDVYSWAVTVNEVATGVFPFSDCTKDNPHCQTILNFGYGRCSSPGLTESLAALLGGCARRAQIHVWEACWKECHALGQQVAKRAVKKGAGCKYAALTACLLHLSNRHKIWSLH
jgi:serine/threonine protein kinase